MTALDPNRPYKVVKVPTAWGVCSGVESKVLHECEGNGEAQALRYQENLEDESKLKGLDYTYEICFYR